MDDTLKVGFVATPASTEAAERSDASRRAMRTRAERLVKHAATVKAKMGEGYGTDVTDLTSAEFKAMMRRMPVRG